MQDRYAGDIGDFVKLAILRALMPGRRLGVAWWLYPDEVHNEDGKHTAYLHHPEKWRAFDQELFDELARVVDQKSRRVKALQDASLLGDAVYADEVIPVAGTPAERRAGRAAWFQRCRETLSDCDLVFADPDNGLETTTFRPGTRTAGKSIALAEVKALSAPGRTLIIYHHQTRRKGGHESELGYWAERLRTVGFSTVDAIRSRSYSARAFFILDASPPLRQQAQQVVLRWGSHLSWHADAHTVAEPENSTGGLDT